MAAKKAVDDDEILTTGQVAKLLKIHQVTVRKLAQRSEIPGWRVGKELAVFAVGVNQALPKKKIS